MAKLVNLALLKRDAFDWDDSTEQAFQLLKTAITSAPVLTLPDYSKDFVVECDASGVGIRVVLMQNGHPIAYISKALAPKASWFVSLWEGIIGSCICCAKMGALLVG